MNWVYVLRCKDNSLYTGWTNNLPRRLAAHNAGRGARYTRGRGPVQLVWEQQFETKNEAMAAEAAIKKLSKQQKEELVNAFLVQKTKE